MTQRSLPTKRELLAGMTRTWDALIATLERPAVAHIANRVNEDGWSIGDHILHLAAWERSVLFILLGRPRHEGLQVDESLYRQGDDAVNAELHRRQPEVSLEIALGQLRDVHQQLVGQLEPLTEAQLLRPYRRFLDARPVDDDERSVLELVYLNTVVHFEEHRGTIEAQLEESA